MNTQERILIVDDEPDLLRLLKRSLQEELGCQIETATSGQEALKLLNKQIFDVVLIDMKMPAMSGLELLELLLEENPWLTVVMMTAHGTIETAVEAMKTGAYDFITKPFDTEAIAFTLQKALERSRLLRENLRLQRDVRNCKPFQDIVGNSARMKRVYELIQMVASTDITVLITGESGTGKDLVARAIHALSDRYKYPFVAVNCPTVPENILESELFGYKKGAFTHATQNRIGLFQEAQRGTIFLDEIGDMSLSAQAKVLRVLQSGEITRVGGEKNIYVDVRVIAATNRNLQEMVKEETFREDLYFRLSVLPIFVPPLRERIEDIPLLVDGFIREFCSEYGFRLKQIEPKVMEVLQQYSWPGNVRELKNLVERVVILSGERIGIKDLPIEVSRKHLPEFRIENFSHLTLKEFKQAMEKAFIKMKLEEASWNITKAAELLGVERTNLHKKIKLYKF